MKAPRSSGARAPQGRPLSPPTHAYLTVPYRLISDLHDNPLAIGLYSLVARLYLVEQRPIPLSTIDVQRYDPSLSRGAILRAFARLVRGGWLLEAVRPGHKTCYTPCWGLVAGTPRRWAMDAPALGRPRHIHALRLERRLLDTCMGRLTPHTTRGALVERYVSQPLLSLSDVGAYVRALHGQQVSTPQLSRLGLIVRGQPQPLPADETILAQASQRCLEEASDLEITEKGLRKLGGSPARPAADQGQPLFFVPPAMIGMVIAPMIGCATQSDEPKTAAQSRKKGPTQTSAPSLGSQFKSEKTSPLPPSSARPEGGGKKPKNQKEHDQNSEQPATVSAQLLRSINVRPAVVAELASLPAALVQAAIADGRSRQGVLDLAGWVVSMLRDVRDHGWELERAKRTGEQEMRERIERAKASGLFVSDDALADTLPSSTSAGVRPAGHGAEILSSPPGGTCCAASLAHATASLPASAGPPPTGAQTLTSSERGRLCLDAREADRTAHDVQALLLRPSAGPALPGDRPASATLDAALRQALRARTRPDVHRVIAELGICWSDQGLLLMCPDAAAVRTAEQQLLPLLRPLLEQLVGAVVPRIAVLLRPQRR